LALVAGVQQMALRVDGQPAVDRFHCINTADKQVLRVQPPTSAVDVTLLAFAAERRAAAPLLLGTRRPPLSINISRPHGAQQQTRRTPQRLRSNDGTGKQTDRQTDTRPFHRPCSAYHAISVNNQT